MTKNLIGSAALLAAAAFAQPAHPDPQMQAVLDQLAALKGKPINTLSAANARKQPTPADAVAALMKKRHIAPETVGNIDNRQIPGPGGMIPIRIYTPKGTGPFPVLFYIHGGGWVIANLDTYDASARALANAARCIVVSTHYRQGPEYKFPAAHADVFAAYQWTVLNAASIGGDPVRIAIAGESAGGNMAAATCLRAKAEHVQMPIYQVLIYPVADSSMSTPSYQENADAKPLNKATMAWFFQNYLNSPDEGRKLWISLVNARNLQGMPPATVITAQIDPLRSEGKMYADHLRAAGVKVQYRNYEGVTHEFFGMGAVVDKAADAQQFAAQGLRTAFAAQPASAK